MRDFTWTALAVVVALLGCGTPEPEPAPEAAPTPAVETPDPAVTAGSRAGSGAPSSTDTAPRASTPKPVPTPAPEPAAASTESPAPATTIQPSSYFVPSGDVEPDQQVPGFPWLRRVTGLNYYLPRLMPADLHRRFQSFEASEKLFGEWGHEWIERADGARALRINSMSPESILSHWLELKAGDVVLFVNHEPIGAAAEDVRAMHERLKTGRRFAVLIERNERPHVISFYVE